VELFTEPLGDWPRKSYPNDLVAGCEFGPESPLAWPEPRSQPRLAVKVVAVALCALLLGGIGASLLALIVTLMR